MLIFTVWDRNKTLHYQAKDTLRYTCGSQPENPIYIERFSLDEIEPGQIVLQGFHHLEFCRQCVLKLELTDFNRTQL